MGAVALILAAGEGTRMKSALPKVAHEVLGLPMVRHVTEAAVIGGCERTVIVTGHGAEIVEGLLEGAEFARQDEQLGTGHAVMCAEEVLAGLEGSLVVLSGDTPLIRPETIRALIDAREQAGAALALLTTEFDDPTGYGRIVRDDSGAVVGIVEHKDLESGQESICEVNTGTYCFDVRVLLEHLKRLDTDNAQGEYYLTDLVGIFRSEGLLVVSASTDQPEETLGVNSRLQLAEATSVMQRRINEKHMLEGVTMVDPSLVWIGPHVELAPDVVIEPMTFLMGDTTVATGAHLGPNTRVTDSSIGTDARVDSSIVVEAVVGDSTMVGPTAYLRAGTVLETGSKAGTSVEIKKSVVGEGSKVPHLSYIGDATIGKGVNIGAGSITCNYDGARKHSTIIEDDVFIGSATMLIAPVKIGRGAVTGAASAIARDVPEGALGIERADQRDIDGWAARRKREQEAANADEEGDSRP